MGVLGGVLDTFDYHPYLPSCFFEKREYPNPGPPQTQQRAAASRAIPSRGPNKQKNGPILGLIREGVCQTPPPLSMRANLFRFSEPTL